MANEEKKKEEMYTHTHIYIYIYVCVYVCSAYFLSLLFLFLLFRCDVFFFFKLCRMTDKRFYRMKTVDLLWKKKERTLSGGDGKRV